MDTSLLADTGSDTPGWLAQVGGLINTGTGIYNQVTGKTAPPTSPTPVATGGFFTTKNLILIGSVIAAGVLLFFVLGRRK